MPLSLRLISISNIKLKMLDCFFMGQILNRYGSYDAPGSQYKYIHCDLTNGEGFHTITLIIAKRFAFVFSSKLHVGPL
jgi:hypothetical protein